VRALLVRFFRWVAPAHVGEGCDVSPTATCVAACCHCCAIDCCSCCWPLVRSSLQAYGVPASVIALGKPLTTADAGSGYVAPATLHSYLATATGALAPAGVMAWSWESTQGPAWISAVYP
jgi:hypothetical protein